MRSYTNVIDIKCIILGRFVLDNQKLKLIGSFLKELNLSHSRTTAKSFLIDLIGFDKNGLHF